jgi:hypothetical protein
MNILALVGSYRKKGNTARIVQMIENRMEEIAAQRGELFAFETLYLGHMAIEFCRGCRTCFDLGEDKCPLKDDIPAIRAKIDAADGIISLMIFKIQQRAWQQAADPDSVDYAYWASNGWFDPDCTFYIEHRANPITVALARLAGPVLAPFVT